MSKTALAEPEIDFITEPATIQPSLHVGSYVNQFQDYEGTSYLITRSVTRIPSKGKIFWTYELQELLVDGSFYPLASNIELLPMITALDEKLMRGGVNLCDDNQLLLWLVSPNVAQVVKGESSVALPTGPDGEVIGLREYISYLQN